MRGGEAWPKAFDTLEIEAPEPPKTATPAPADQIHDIEGERTTFRMPRCVQIAPAAPAASTANSLDALLARMKAFAPQLRELSAAGQ